MEEQQSLLSVQRMPAWRGTPSKAVTGLLPLVRFTTISTVLIAVDSLVCIGLWLAGGSSQYLEDNVEEFSIYKSTFDLACISASRAVVSIGCLYYLEHYSLLAQSTSRDSVRASSNRLSNVCSFVFLATSLSTLCYAAVKVGLIASKWQTIKDDLHITYKILCVVGVVTALINMGVWCVSVWYMRRLSMLLKLKYILEEEGRERPRPKANLKRLAMLAIPVSGVYIMGSTTIWCP